VGWEGERRWEGGGEGGEKGFHQFLEDIPLTYFCH
jgi:hypothetical protein